MLLFPEAKIGTLRTDWQKFRTLANAVDQNIEGVIPDQKSQNNSICAKIRLYA